MKNVSDWKFSAPIEQVDLPRIMEEASDSSKGRAKGVVRVGLKNGIVLLVNRDLTVGNFDLRRPDGYLTNRSQLVNDSGVVSEMESAFVYAPAGAVAVFRCSTQNEADELLGKIVKRVEVSVEVF